MSTDAFLDLDVIAQNPGPYKLLGQLEARDLYRALQTLADAEIQHTVADRVHEAMRFVRPILDLAPALKEAFDLDELARKWGIFKFDRQAELLHLSLSLPQVEPEALIDVEGAEYLNIALERGAPFLTPIHAGPFQLIPFVLARMGYSLATFMEAGSVSLWRRIGIALMDAANPNIYAGITPIPLPSKRGPREAIRLNREGLLVLTFPEFTMGEPPKHAVRFLGTQAWAVDGVARMAWLNRRDLLPLIFRARGDGRYVLRFYPPIRVSSREEVLQATAEFYRWLEKRVWEEPHAWLSWAFFESHMHAARVVEQSTLA